MLPLLNHFIQVTFLCYRVIIFLLKPLISISLSGFLTGLAQPENRLRLNMEESHRRTQRLCSVASITASNKSVENVFNNNSIKTGGRIRFESLDKI